MNFEEHAAKPLLAAAGIAVPESRLAASAEEAAEAAEAVGPAMVKAQAPTGKRDKAGGIMAADAPDDARAAAQAILGMAIDGHVVERVLVEARADIAAEFYAAVMNDPATKGPLALFSALGGMDIEDAAAQDTGALRRAEIDIRRGFDVDAARAMLKGLDLGSAGDAAADALVKLYDVYRANDAELVEVNPLALTAAGGLVALDCKFVLDDSAIPRRPELAATGAPERLTELEARGEAAGIKYIELAGDVGILANGAGLTMTTMDVVRHHSGRPANFCEIGGEAYTKARTALELVLAKPGVKSLVVNFCGAFARCDVMMEGLLEAWQALKPEVPVFFSIAGTGDTEAIAMLRDRLGMAPMADMDAACQAAAEAAASDAPSGDA